MWKRRGGGQSAMADGGSASVFHARVQSLQVRKYLLGQTVMQQLCDSASKHAPCWQEAVLEGVTTDSASAVVATARALSRADVSASWVATAEACLQRLPLSLPESRNCRVEVTMWLCKTSVLVFIEPLVVTLVLKMQVFQTHEAVEVTLLPPASQLVSRRVLSYGRL